MHTIGTHFDTYIYLFLYLTALFLFTKISLPICQRPYGIARLCQGANVRRVYHAARFWRRAYVKAILSCAKMTGHHLNNMRSLIDMDRLPVIFLFGFRSHYLPVETMNFETKSATKINR